MYLIFSILMMVMAANDWMLTNMVGALAFAMIIGTVGLLTYFVFLAGK